MLKKLFRILNGGETRGSFFDRCLLIIGLALLFFGMVLRVMEKFTAIGPESGSFLILGIFLAVLAAVGMGVAKYRGNKERDGS